MWWIGSVVVSGGSGVAFMPKSYPMKMMPEVARVHLRHGD